eukprot:TRINITY_DN19898_c0_g1_i2.p1 TRINITY_DN19898_c0_g1~~TRINITY_DN19898_c0_g1_i2.p1  ORF type:complete len:447 (-),score=104.35 TRINITY_DN19898_c0_g1_i2:153-1493(-)
MPSKLQAKMCRLWAQATCLAQVEEGAAATRSSGSAWDIAHVAEEAVTPDSCFRSRTHRSEGELSNGSALVCTDSFPSCLAGAKRGSPKDLALPAEGDGAVAKRCRKADVPTSGAALWEARALDVSGSDRRSAAQDCSVDATLVMGAAGSPVHHGCAFMDTVALQTKTLEMGAAHASTIRCSIPVAAALAATLPATAVATGASSPHASRTASALATSESLTIAASPRSVEAARHQEADIPAVTIAATPTSVAAVMREALGDHALETAGQRTSLQAAYTVAASRDARPVAATAEVVQSPSLRLRAASGPAADGQVKAAHPLPPTLSLADAWSPELEQLCEGELALPTTLPLPDHCEGYVEEVASLTPRLAMPVEPVLTLQQRLFDSLLTSSSDEEVSAVASEKRPAWSGASVSKRAAQAEEAEKLRVVARPLGAAGASRGRSLVMQSS